jgi:hypothetical protein
MFRLWPSLIVFNRIMTENSTNRELSQQRAGSAKGTPQSKPRLILTCIRQVFSEELAHPSFRSVV